MKYLGIFISIGLIIAGLSGEFTLRGTESSIALVVVGIIFLFVDIVKLTGDKDNLEQDEQMEHNTERYRLRLCEADMKQYVVLPPHE